MVIVGKASIAVKESVVLLLVNLRSEHDLFAGNAGALARIERELGISN